MNAIIISRVSTEEQKNANNSLPAQKVRLEQYCQRKGYDIIKKFSFDESAYKENRKDFDEILDFVINQKETVAVCFDKVDRLSRNIFDKGVSLLYEKATKSEIELHFVSDGLIINDQKSATEKFQFNIGLSLAKYYSDAISDNVKRAIEAKLQRKEWPGKAPFGYKNIDQKDGKKHIVQDEYKSQIVKKIFEWYASGSTSFKLIREKLLKDYNIKYSQGMLDSMLKNPFYYGEMKYNGRILAHKYEPIIARCLFDKVQRVKASYHKKPHKFAGLPYPYRGLIHCADCGCMITPEKKKNKFIYYHCTQYHGKHTNAKWLREEQITNQLGKAFQRLQVPQEVVEDILDALKQLHGNKQLFREDQVTNLNSEKEKYAQRLERLVEMRMDASITKSKYEEKRKEYRAKQKEITKKIGKLNYADEEYYLTSEYLLKLASNAGKLFESSEVHEKRLLLKMVLQNLELNGRKAQFDWIKPFDKIAFYASRQSWLRG